MHTFEGTNPLSSDLLQTEASCVDQDRRLSIIIPRRRVSSILRLAGSGRSWSWTSPGSLFFIQQYTCFFFACFSTMPSGNSKKKKNVWLRAQNNATNNLLPLFLETYLVWNLLFLSSFLSNFYLPVIIQCSIAAKFNPDAVNSEYTKWQCALKDRHKMDCDDAVLFDNWEHVFQPFNDTMKCGPDGSSPFQRYWIVHSKTYYPEVKYVQSIVCTLVHKGSQAPSSLQNRLFKRALASEIPDHWKI